MQAAQQASTVLVLESADKARLYCALGDAELAVGTGASAVTAYRRSAALWADDSMAEWPDEGNRDYFG